MALIERRTDPELTVIARYDRRPLPEARVDHRLHPCLVADVGKPRGHVAVARPVALLVSDSHAGFGSHDDALVAHRLAECVGTGDECDRCQIAALEIGEDLLTSHL